MKPLDTEQVFENRIFPLFYFEESKGPIHFGTATLIKTPNGNLFFVTAKHVFRDDENILRYGVCIDGVYFPFESVHHLNDIDISLCCVPRVLDIFGLNFFNLMNCRDVQSLNSGLMFDECKEFQRRIGQWLRVADPYEHYVSVYGYPECKTKNHKPFDKCYHGVGCLCSGEITNFDKEEMNNIKPDLLKNMHARFNPKRAKLLRGQNKFFLENLRGVSGGPMLKIYYCLESERTMLVEMEFCGIFTDYKDGYMIGVKKKTIFDAINKLKI